MGAFLSATKRFLAVNGRNMTYSRITEGSYNVETGTSTNTSSDSTIRIYKKHVRANQYNYPNLVGKDIAEFYILATDLASKPDIRDKITDGTDVYQIDSFRTHEAHQEVILYVALGVKG